MNRRGFLSGLSAVSVAAPAVALARADFQGEKPYGFTWNTVCPNRSCATPLAQFIDMTQPIRVGTQCPKCLYVIDTTPLAEKIREFNGQDAYGRPLNGEKRALFGRDIKGNRVAL